MALLLLSYLAQLSTKRLLLLLNGRILVVVANDIDFSFCGILIDLLATEIVLEHKKEKTSDRHTKRS
jgi:hypothetical protein